MKPASPFAKTRQDHLTETAEDYVEAIEYILGEQPECRVKDLARRIGVSHVTVTRILQRLTGGLINKKPYGPCTLTSEGMQMACRSRKRHDIVLAFLLAIGVPESTAIHDAEGIEHHVSTETLDAMRNLVAQHETKG